MKLTGDGSFSFTADTLGDDIVVKNVNCTWFGGDDDPQDNGQTASGVVTKGHPDLLGCSLPMDGFNHKSTNGSPIPRLPWKTHVEVTNRANGKTITVPLIDLGPSKFAQSKAAIDLSQAAFLALGAKKSQGVFKADYRIIGGAKHVPGAFISSVSLGTSLISEPETINNTFAAFVASLGLRHFSAVELLVNTNKVRNGVSNTAPPRELWQNIVPTIIVLDELRNRLGVPIHTLSTFRAKDYNDQIDGAAKRSQHLDFRAIDFTTPSLDMDDLAAAARKLRGTSFTAPVAALKLVAKLAPLTAAALKINSKGGKTTFEWHGGVAAYNTFVHIDCRGDDADWG